MLAMGAAVGPAVARTREERPAGDAERANGGRAPRAAAGLSFASIWAVAAAAADPLAPAAAELAQAASLPAAAAAGDTPSPAAASTAPSSTAPTAAGKGASVGTVPAAAIGGGDGAAPAGPSSASQPAPAHSGSGGGAVKKTALAPEKPCRVCSDAQDLFAAFAKFEQRQAAAAGSGSGTRGAGSAAHGSAAGGKPAPGAPPALPPLVAPNADPGAPFWVPGERVMPCPPDAGALGRATWAFLHSTAAYLPDEPTPAQSSAAAALLDAVAELYPCGYCAAHLRSYMDQHPPDTRSGTALSAWLCAKHNEVNARLGKPAFDCGAVGARWRDGPAEGEPECDEAAGRL